MEEDKNINRSNEKRVVKDRTIAVVLFSLTFVFFLSLFVAVIFLLNIWMNSDGEIRTSEGLNIVTSLEEES